MSRSVTSSVMSGAAVRSKDAPTLRKPAAERIAGTLVDPPATATMCGPVRPSDPACSARARSRSSSP